MIPTIVSKTTYNSCPQPPPHLSLEDAKNPVELEPMWPINPASACEGPKAANLSHPSFSFDHVPNQVRFS